LLSIEAKSHGVLCNNRELRQENRMTGGGIWMSNLST
jgi:hypothetical protein